MTLTIRQWTVLSVGSAALLIGLAWFGGGYRSLGVLFLPLGLWLELIKAPDQRQIRPAIRVLGYVFVGVAVVAIMASVFAIAARR